MSFVDLAILIAAAAAFGNGIRRGFSLSSLSYLGLVAGTAVGALLAPPLSHALNAGPSYSPFVGLAMLFLAASVGSSVGYAFGEPLRMRLLRSTRGGGPDTVLGGVFSIFTVLATAWFLSLAFARGPVPLISRQIQDSAILRAIDSVFPRPPSFLAGVESTLASVPYPQVFDRLGRDIPGPVQVDPAVANNPAVTGAAARTVKVRSLGCGGEVFGSAYPIATDYLVSNAHVVAGTHSHRVITADNRTLSATVVLFDPERDVSVLYVPKLDLAPLVEATAASRDTAGATIGYPGGGDERVAAAAVRGRVEAVGRDIYGNSEVRREIYVLQAEIHPGNSGGPMVDSHGQVVGLVFANSTTDPSEGYALTDAEIQPDLNAGVGRNREVDVQGCAG